MHNRLHRTKLLASVAILIAAAFILSWLEMLLSIPMIIPGVKLGLANTVLLYAVYLMDWKSCILLMLTKVVLSGLIFGSLSAIWFSLAGGALSLAVMLLVRKNPAR